jgi:ribonuclease/clavin/mitogillin
MLTRIAVDAPTRATTGETYSYVIADQDALLVDPAGRSDELTATLRDRDPSHVAVTHHHPDHVEAVAHYASEFELTVWSLAGREQVFESATGCAPDATFRPGETIPAGDGVRIFDTPGHAPEHVAFDVSGAIDDNNRANEAFITGDLAVAVGSVVVGGPGADMRAYLTSLRRLIARLPETLYPAHGPVIDSPVETCERLLAHRLERERKVEQAVADGCTNVEQILDAVYEKDIDGVYDLAHATVVAHLDKLAVEGTVDWDGEQAYPT